MKKIIGVDIDGCINDFPIQLKKVVQKHYDINCGVDEYNMLKLLNITERDEMEAFWDKHNAELYELINVQDDAKKVLYKLQSEGYRIIIITARLYKDAKNMEEWLNRNEIPYDEIYFNGMDKIDACKWKEVSVMIEDNPRNIESLSNNGVHAIKANWPYNKDIKNELVHPCDNWREIYNEIHKLI